MPPEALLLLTPCRDLSFQETKRFNRLIFCIVIADRYLRGTLAFFSLGNHDPAEAAARTPGPACHPAVCAFTSFNIFCITYVGDKTLTNHICRGPDGRAMGEAKIGRENTFLIDISPIPSIFRSSLGDHRLIVASPSAWLSGPEARLADFILVFE